MFSGISPSSLLLILLIVLVVFGSKKLKNIGSDIGGAVKGFRKAMNDDDKSSDPAKLTDDSGNGETNSSKSESSQHS